MLSGFLQSEQNNLMHNLENFKMDFLDLFFEGVKISKTECDFGKAFSFQNCLGFWGFRDFLRFFGIYKEFSWNFNDY